MADTLAVAHPPDTGIRLDGLRKRYGGGDTAVDALKGVDMQIAPGEVVGLVGPSGSGKSTLLKCLGAVIEPSGGRMILGGKVIYDEGWRIPDLGALRRDKIGFIFQAPYLIPFLDVTDNVALPAMLAGHANTEARRRAQELLALQFNVAADVWSATSFNQLRRDALTADRWNLLHPAKSPRRPYLNTVLDSTEGPIIAATDYMKIVADQIAPWLSGRLHSLGTDGFGRSDNRQQLRRFFEVDAESIALAALYQLAQSGTVPKKLLPDAITKLGINPEKANPMIS